MNGSTKEEINQYKETDENEHTRVQNLWVAAKTVPKGMFVIIQADLKKQEKPQMNNLMSHLHKPLFLSKSLALHSPFRGYVQGPGPLRHYHLGLRAFQAAPGLLRLPGTYFWTPSQEMEDRHLMERRAGQSMPGCVRAALPQQAFTPRREVSEGADACHLQHVRRRVRHFPHNVSFPNPHHTTDLRPLTLLRNENIRSHPTHSHSGKIGDSNTGSSSSGVHGLSTAPYYLPVLGAKRLGSPF